jgi:hypothetical protein
MNISGYEMDVFGDTDPRKMPTHLFFGALNMDFDSAERADISKQDYSVCPRHWYIDATFPCKTCGTAFVFSAKEQRFWYEELRFYVDSQPRRCPACRKKHRKTKLLKQQYERLISKAISSKDVSEKKTVVGILDELASASHCLTERMTENRELLLRQIKKREAETDAPPNEASPQS